MRGSLPLYFLEDLALLGFLAAFFTVVPFFGAPEALFSRSATVLLARALIRLSHSSISGSAESVDAVLALLIVGTATGAELSSAAGVATPAASFLGAGLINLIRLKIVNALPHGNLEIGLIAS
jgi:hypothetical protein